MPDLDDYIGNQSVENEDTPFGDPFEGVEELAAMQSFVRQVRDEYIRNGREWCNAQTDEDAICELVEKTRRHGNGTWSEEAIRACYFEEEAVDKTEHGCDFDLSHADDILQELKNIHGECWSGCNPCCSCSVTQMVKDLYNAHSDLRPI